MESISQTERLFIRQLSLDDLPELTQILSDAQVMEYSVRGVCDEAATRQFIEWCLGCYQSHGMGPWALVDKCSGELVGFCGVSPETVGTVVEVNLGYRLARRYWGMGLATEATRAVLGYVFNRQLADSVVVIIQPEHVASLRVAEKSGFAVYGELTFHEKPVRMYRMTCEQWAAQSPSSAAPWG